MATLTLEQVLAQVAAADPQTFYQLAQRFEQAAGELDETKGQLSKYRRDLAEAWHNQDMQKHNRIDRLVQHLEGIVASVENPGYAQMLRQVGDAIVDSKQRLEALKEDKANATDDAARSDIDKQAATVLDGLSTSYRQMGGALAELPESSATSGTTAGSAGAGAAANEAAGAGAAAAQQASSSGGTAAAGAGTAAKGRTSGSFATTAGSISQKGAGAFAVAQSQSVMNGSAAPPEAAALFSRFSQYAGGPAQTGSVQGGRVVQGQGQAVAGLAGKTSAFAQQQSTRSSVLGRTSAGTPGGATMDEVKQSKRNGQANSSSLPSSSSSSFGGGTANSDRQAPSEVSGNRDRKAQSGASAPSRLETEPALAATGNMPVLFGTTAGPAGQSSVTGHSGSQSGAANPGGVPATAQAAVSQVQATAQASTQAVAAQLTPQAAQSPSTAPISAAATPTGASVGTPTGASIGAPTGTSTGTSTGASTGTSTSWASPQIPAQVAPHTPTPTSVSGQASFQARPIVALGAEHLQAATLASGGAPLGATTASSNITGSSVPPATMMPAASAALPAGPRGVLGGSRAEVVWLRADPGSWATASPVPARLGRYESTEDGNVRFRTARRVKKRKEGR
jgi:hypothetical protein